MLRSSKPVRLFAAEHRRLNAIRPSEPPLAGLIDRPIAVRGDGKKAAADFNHLIQTSPGRWHHKGNAAQLGSVKRMHAAPRLQSASSVDVALSHSGASSVSTIQARACRQLTGK